MNYSTVTYEVKDRVATVTMNRPDKRNALDETMIEELAGVLQNINRSAESRVAILTGAGGFFCAGMDLDYLRIMSDKGHEDNLKDAHNFLNLLEIVSNLKKPIIAMVDGPALGGGCGLAAACDFVLAAKDSSRLGTPEVHLGFVPAVILVFLIKRMGEGRAKELVLRGNILDAAKAKEVGLVTEIIEDSKLKPTTVAFAEELAATTSPSSINLTKELFSRMNDMNLKEIMEYAANLNALARKTGDFRKGIDSFIKKEKLQW
ncbi:MAG: enoyl-CoA hydratase/isomerase family protein [Bacteroidota bacterium]|jgi:methylglutaconyl-CoA hydratase